MLLPGLTFAPRIPPRLLLVLARLDDASVPIAETCRRLGNEADRLGITRPSYERVRVLVWRLRARSRRPPRVRLAWRFEVGLGKAEALLEHALRVDARRRE